MATDVDHDHEQHNTSTVTLHGHIQHILLYQLWENCQCNALSKYLIIRNFTSNAVINKHTHNTNNCVLIFTLMYICIHLKETHSIAKAIHTSLLERAHHYNYVHPEFSLVGCSPSSHKGRRARPLPYTHPRAFYDPMSLWCSNESLFGSD